MKVFIRTLWSDDKRGALWTTEHQKQALKNYLNDLGFYVLTGAGDSLEVYAIDYDEALDIKVAKKSLDKIRKVWYNIVRKK